MTEFNDSIPEKIKTGKTAMSVLGVIFFIYAAIFGLIWFILGIMTLASGDDELIMMGIFSIFLAIVFGILFIVLGIITLKAAKAILEKKPWARTWGIIFGILSVTLIVGIFILISMFSDEAKVWFGV